MRLDCLSQGTVRDRQTCQGKALGAALQHVLYVMSGAPRGTKGVSQSPRGESEAGAQVLPPPLAQH